jgi:hypothetical protein
MIVNDFFNEFIRVQGQSGCEYGVSACMLSQDWRNHLYVPVCILARLEETCARSHQDLVNRKHNISP